MKIIELKYLGITNSEMHRNRQTGEMDFSDMLNKHTALSPAEIKNLIDIYKNAGTGTDDLINRLNWISNEIYTVMTLMVSEKYKVDYKTWETNMLNYFGKWSNDTLKFKYEIELESNLDWEDIDAMPYSRFYSTYFPTEFKKFIILFPEPQKPKI